MKYRVTSHFLAVVCDVQDFVLMIGFVFLLVCCTIVIMYPDFPLSMYVVTLFSCSYASSTIVIDQFLPFKRTNHLRSVMVKMFALSMVDCGLDMLIKPTKTIKLVFGASPLSHSIKELDQRLVSLKSG